LSKTKDNCKARAMFLNANAMCEDAEFCAMLRNWGRVARLDNMVVERLLALIKQAASQSKIKKPLAERVAGAGFLSQWLKEHRSAADNDFRVLTRSKLLEQGTPLNSASKGLGLFKNSSGKFRYLSFRMSGRGGNLPKLTKEEYSQFRGQCFKDFDDLPDGEKESFRSDELDSAILRRSSDSAPAARSSWIDASFVATLGNDHMPITEENFVEAVSKDLQDHGQFVHGGSIGGFSNYSSVLRERYQKRFWVPEAGHRLSPIASQTRVPSCALFALRFCFFF
jgi:hypothetical protein